MTAGFNAQRVVRLIEDAIERCALDLSGRNVTTEAATGAYAVTPIVAAMAGAEKVRAFTRDSRHGSVADVQRQTRELCTVAGCGDRIEVVEERNRALFAGADIVTNSGHLRPLDAETISWIEPGSVIPLMYEAWELRTQDLDLEACRARQIPVVGTNERHELVAVFDFLGVLCVRLLHDLGVAVHGSETLLLCDNAFGPFIESGLAGAGARVDRVEALRDAQGTSYDVLVYALEPRPEPRFGAADAQQLASRWPGIVFAQFWGDVDRAALAAAGVAFGPELEPAPGHMGILLSAVGPEPIVRLQVGSFKAAEVALRGGDADGWFDLL